MPPRKNLGLPKSPRLPEPAVATKTATSTKIILTIAMAAAAVVGFTYIASGFALVQQMVEPSNDQLLVTAGKPMPTKSTTSPEQAAWNKVMEMYKNGEVTFKYANDCQDPEDQPFVNNPNIFLANDITAYSLTFYTKTESVGQVTKTMMDWDKTLKQLNAPTPVSGTAEYCPVEETPADDAAEYFCIDEATLKKITSSNTELVNLLIQSMAVDSSTQEALSQAIAAGMAKDQTTDICAYLKKQGLGCFVYGKMNATCPNATTCVTDKDNQHYNACGISNDVLANMSYREDLKGVIQAVMAENSIDLPERDSLQWQLGAMLTAINAELPDPQFTIGDLKIFLNSQKLSTEDKVAILRAIHENINQSLTKFETTIDNIKDLTSQQKTDMKNKAKQMVAEIDGIKIENLANQLVGIIQSLRLSDDQKAQLKAMVADIADAAQQRISEFDIEDVQKTVSDIVAAVKKFVDTNQKLTKEEKKALVDLARNSSFVTIGEIKLKIKGVLAEIDAKTTAKTIVDNMKTVIAANKKLTPEEKQTLINNLTQQISNTIDTALKNMQTNIAQAIIDAQKTMDQVKLVLKTMRTEEAVKTKIVAFINDYTRKTMPIPAKIDLKSLIIKTKEYIQTLSKEDVKQALLSKLAEIQSTAENAAAKWQTAKDKMAAVKTVAKEQIPAAKAQAEQAIADAKVAKAELQKKIDAWKDEIEDLDYSQERATAKTHAEEILSNFADTIVVVVGGVQDIVDSAQEFIANRKTLKDVQSNVNNSCTDKDLGVYEGYPGGDPYTAGYLEYSNNFDRNIPMKPDYCDATTNHVYQSVCDPNITYQASEWPCFSGCDSGACKK